MEPIRDACYQELIAELQIKFWNRDSEVTRLLHTGSVHMLHRRAQEMRKRLINAIAPWPEFVAGDLSPVCNSTVQRNGYRIENICIQAMDGYYLPVSVYVPARAQFCAPYPAVLVPMGHWPEGKRNTDNQRMCANLALNGFVAANFDPMLQGERQPFTDEALRQMFGDIPEDLIAVALHMLPGNQCYMMGRNLAAYFLFEGVRIIDYLCTRSDVDVARIGASGQSGGGTQATYLAAYDNRIRAYSPIQCLSKQALLMQRSGIGDCEQSLLGIHSDVGFEYPDILWASFPKPVMVSAGQDDFFYLEGVRQLEAEMALLYDNAGYKHDFSVCVAPCAHTISPQTRMFAVNWFSKQFYGTHEEIFEQDIILCSREELACFPNGLITKTPLDVNLEVLHTLQNRRNCRLSTLHKALDTLLAVYHDTYTIEPLWHLENGEAFVLYTAQNRHAACRFFLRPEPTLTFIIDDGTADISAFLKLRGSVAVVSPWGMTPSHKQKAGYDDDTRLYNASAVMGQSLTAQRLNQLIALLDYLQTRTSFSHVNVAGFGVGGQLAALLAFFDQENHISKTALCDCQLSFDAVFGRNNYKISETSIITGLSAICDLPDILHANAAQTLAVNPLDFQNNPCNATHALPVHAVQATDSAKAAALFFADAADSLT